MRRRLIENRPLGHPDHGRLPRGVLLGASLSVLLACGSSEGSRQAEPRGGLAGAEAIAAATGATGGTLKGTGGAAEPSPAGGRSGYLPASGGNVNGTGATSTIIGGGILATGGNAQASTGGANPGVGGNAQPGTGGTTSGIGGHTQGGMGGTTSGTGGRLPTTGGTGSEIGGKSAGAAGVSSGTAGGVEPLGGSGGSADGLAGTGGLDPNLGGASGGMSKAGTGMGGAETGGAPFETVHGLNSPLIRHIFTADPAALAHGDRFYIYAGRDEAALGAESYRMYEWHVFSTNNMADWTDHGAVMRPTDFSWGASDAWAGHVVEREGKFYWYVPIRHRTINGFAIGVAVADSPTGPFADARGSAIITNDMTTNVNSSYDDIDPAVFVDDDSQAYLYWGNTSLKAIRLQDNMIDTEGEIVYLDVPSYTEAPYMNKVNGTYYLTYAYGWPEAIVYATSDSPLGPFSTPKTLNATLPSETNHQSLVEFNGTWYFVYHNAALLGGSPHHRSVTADLLHFEDDGSIREIERTEGGVEQTGPGPVADDTEYRIVSRLSGKLMVPSSGNDGAAVVQLSEAGTENEKWQFRRVGSGTYRILNAASEFCLDVAGGSTEGRAEIQQVSCVAETRQYFRLIGTGDGYFAIVNYTSGKVLDILDQSTADGAAIIQWDYLYNENQQWEIVK